MIVLALSACETRQIYKKQKFPQPPIELMKDPGDLKTLRS